ncbi:MAG TPA: VOC family protein [Ignavibacteria bacterium]|nr:VOC family protein [Ignavibacteria bacterium]
MFKCQHVVISMSDKKTMREFYINKLGLNLLEEEDHFFACAAGPIRFSFFAGAKKYPVNEDATGVTIILRTDNIIQTKEELTAKGISFLGDIVEAPGFMKYLTIEDPDNNLIYISEYYREPV